MGERLYLDSNDDDLSNIMKKIFKRIMACTLAGAIIAGSFGGII